MVIKEMEEEDIIIANYEGIDCLNSCIGKCKYSVWQIDFFLREE